jgi:hypothetical protein
MLVVEEAPLAFECVFEGKRDPGLNTAGVACRFAGSQCHFSKTSMALAPYLQNDDDLTRRLREHGIQGAQTDLQRFAISLRDRGGSEGRNVILLVDSVDKAQQTQDILNELEGILGRAFSGSRAWVHIYDLRVLDNITTLEDASIMNKDFDGFSDPWRRWQVGIL